MADVVAFATSEGLDVLAGDALAATWTGDFRHDTRIDFGRVVEKRPTAVLRPRDRDQLAACMRFLFAQRIPYVTRGAAHSSGGQALGDSVVIDLRALDRIVDDDPAGETITVEGGAWWLAVVQHLHAQGRRPMSVTANLRSSIAGTLSVGGFGDSAHAVGLQISHVTRMTVCAPDGTLHRVGPDDDLFRFSLAGRGQLGVIVDATLQTVHRPWTMVGRSMGWLTLASFVRDADVIARRGLYDFLRARVQLAFGRTAVHAHVGRASQTLDDDPRASELRPDRIEEPQLVDVHALLVAEPPDDALACPALEIVLPIANALAAWAELHPLIAAARIPALQPEGHSVMIVPRDPRFPLAPLPSAWSMMIALRPKLPVAELPTILPALRAIGRRAMELGGRLYLMSIALDDPRFAERQFGADLARFRALKARFDPHALLNPGLL